eukprot:CAMPEP_0184234168 /NCGR_PEP_ID=MMETSP0976-20121227/24671_1 /TAXON_ID=483370 /ORGANISM="non described non described, Strain CCMP2097" /LENGTH=122 /DNA_ID=CAMNT_0026539225 /DNA_START=42 /DNA_END=413 /DNA_ORIENTATION=+
MFASSCDLNVSIIFGASAATASNSAGAATPAAPTRTRESARLPLVRLVSNARSGAFHQLVQDRPGGLVEGATSGAEAVERRREVDVVEYAALGFEEGEDVCGGVAGDDFFVECHRGIFTAGP